MLRVQLCFRRFFPKFVALFLKSDNPIKKVSSFVVYLLFCIDLKWKFQTVISVTFYFIISEKLKTHASSEKVV